MARPRTISDEELIAATVRVMSRLGPVKMTLAAVAEEAGVTAATLVQRFGSKRRLMLTSSLLRLPCLQLNRWRQRTLPHLRKPGVSPPLRTT